MGGRGSGLRPSGKYRLVDNSLPLSVVDFRDDFQASVERQVKKVEFYSHYHELLYGVLYTHDSHENALIVHGIKTKRKTIKLEQSIQLRFTLPYYGGKRYWFTCPKCESRAGKLYLPPLVESHYRVAAGKWEQRFQCRACHRLVYGSQRFSENGFWDTTVACVLLNEVFILRKPRELILAEGIDAVDQQAIQMLRGYHAQQPNRQQSSGNRG